MRFKKPCIICKKQFRPTGYSSKTCEKCIKKNFITRLFNKYGHFKGCNTLEEALSKYGK